MAGVFSFVPGAEGAPSKILAAGFLVAVFLLRIRGYKIHTPPRARLGPSPLSRVSNAARDFRRGTRKFAALPARLKPYHASDAPNFICWWYRVARTNGFRRGSFLGPDRGPAGDLDGPPACVASSRGGKNRPPLGGLGRPVRIPVRANWLGLDRRGTATGKARRHRTPWLDDSQFGARSLDPNVLFPGEGPVNFSALRENVNESEKSQKHYGKGRIRVIDRRVTRKPPVAADRQTIHQFGGGTNFAGFASRDP